MALAVDQHPQRQKIIDMILAGKPLREISAAVAPHISHTAIQRYRNQVVVPAMANAGQLSKVLHAKGINPVEALGNPEIGAVTQAALAAAPVLAVREQRLAALQDRHNRLLKIVEERATEMDGETAGGGSGLLTRDYKGKDADTPVYKVDTGLLAEFREHEKQAAMELGQWNEGASVGQQINIVGPVTIQQLQRPNNYSGEVIDLSVTR